MVVMSLDKINTEIKCFFNYIAWSMQNVNNLGTFFVSEIVET